MPPWMTRREVGDDVAEHVGRDAHVVILGLRDEPLGEGVDDREVLLDVGVAFADLAKICAEELAAAKDVVLERCR